MNRLATGGTVGEQALRNVMGVDVDAAKGRNHLYAMISALIGCCRRRAWGVPLVQLAAGGAFCADGRLSAAGCGGKHGVESV
jgi:hypothetical protein